MKHYEALVDLGCFSRRDAVELSGSEAAAASLIHSYKKKGLIQSVRRDLFVTVSMETKQPVANRFAIGSHIASDACITHHSAFAYYGYANQVFYEIYVASGARFREFEFDGYLYRHLPLVSDSLITKRGDKVSVSEIERTVVDNIADFEKVAGLEELLCCLELIPFLDAPKLLDYLKERDIAFLWQKVGYILEHFSEHLQLPDSFFAECIRHLPKGKRYLFGGYRREPLQFERRWQLYVPPNLMGLLSQGGVEYDSYK